jgi:3-oxoacyl-[acyl-carrier-protein] synthase-3
MRGQDTFRAAVDAMSSVAIEALAAEGMSVGDADLFVFHQANARITAAVRERLGVPSERVVDCIEQLGNASAATLPLALADAGRAGTLRRGARVLLAAFGAGFVWGGGLMVWDGELA